jgi:hypothetical protein
MDRSGRGRLNRLMGGAYYFLLYSVVDNAMANRKTPVIGLAGRPSSGQLDDGQHEPEQGGNGADQPNLALRDLAPDRGKFREEAGFERADLMPKPGHVLPCREVREHITVHGFSVERDRPPVNYDESLLSKGTKGIYAIIVLCYQ